MSMIDFLQRHEKIIQENCTYPVLKVRLENMLSNQPDYQRIADNIYEEIAKKELFPEDDTKLKVGDEVVGQGKFWEKVKGIRGRIVKIRGFIYDVEWNRKVVKGHSCHGLAKEGHGLHTQKKSITKANTLETPQVENKKDYENFLNNLFESVKGKEYLDHGDRNFQEGERGIIKRIHNSGDYIVFPDGTQSQIRSANFAKVKRKEVFHDKDEALKEIEGIIEELEGKNNLSEYRRRMEEIFSGFSNLVEEGKVSQEEVDEFTRLIGLQDFKFYLDSPIEDDELEELLK